MWLTPPSPCSTPLVNDHLPSCRESPAMTRFSVALSSTRDFGLSGATFQSLNDFASRIVTQPPWASTREAAEHRTSAASSHVFRIRIAPTPFRLCGGGRHYRDG